MTQMPIMAYFQKINKRDVDGSKSIFLYVSDGSWQMPANLLEYNPDNLHELPGFAGCTGVFVFDEGSRVEEKFGEQNF